MTERIVLAYSGGLDTSVAIGWIGEATGAEVIAVAVDVGQGGESLETIRQRALGCGAVEAYVADARDEFANEYCMPTLKANALYQGHYPLVSAISRPVIVKHLVKAAREFGATTVAHGCTGKGNDQVRFEVGIQTLGPDLKCIAPVRDLALTRDKAIAFAEEKGLPIETTKKNPYSIDQNVWGRAVETGYLEDIWNAPTKDIYDYTATPEFPPAPDEVTISFEAGVPVAIDGVKRHPAAGHPGTEPPRRRPGRGPDRRRRGPPGGHQVPRNLRGARRHGADHRAQAPRGHHRRARAGPLQGHRRPALGRTGLRRPVVLAAQALPGRLHRGHPAATSPATSA